MASLNSIAVLNFLKQHYGQEFSKQQIAEELGISVPAVVGSMNGYIKKGLIDNTREEVVELAPATETRKAQTKVIKYHTLNEAGLAYDPEVEEAKKAAEKAAEKERKAAEKAAKKAEKEAIDF